MQKIIKENLTKNVFLVFLLIILYFPIQTYLENSSLIADKASAGSVLVAVSIIAVIACFGAFAFTYEKISEKSTFQRYLAHFTTGLLMLIIGVSLIFTSTLISFVMGNFLLFDFILALLYLAIIGYDFWDLLRIYQ